MKKIIFVAVIFLFLPVFAQANDLAAAVKFMSVLDTYAATNPAGILSLKQTAIHDLKTDICQAAYLAENNNPDEARLLLQTIPEQLFSIFNIPAFSPITTNSLDCNFFLTTWTQAMVIGAFFGTFALGMFDISYPLGVLFSIPFLILCGAGTLLAPVAIICIPFL